MKTLILFTLLTVFSLTVFSQTQASKDTTKKTQVKQPAPKPTFNFDPQKQYHIALDLTSEQINIFTIKRDEWKLKVQRNPQFNGLTIGNFEDFDDATKQDILNQLLVQQKAEIQKFNADTTLLFHPKQKLK